jgi:hypothetical protein
VRGLSWIEITVNASLPLAVGIVVAACCGGGSSGKSCSATITFKGGSYGASGTGSDAKAESLRLACRKYCKTNDPSVKAAWTKWKATPEGRSSTGSADAEMEVRTDLFAAVNACQYDCVGEMTINPGSAKVTCKEP